MSSKELRFCSSWSILKWVVFVMLSLQGFVVKSQDLGDYSQLDNPQVVQVLTQRLYGTITNMTNVISKDISDKSKFCVKDPQTEWDRAFDYSSNLDFLSACIEKTNGGVQGRLCTASEIRFYFNSLFDQSSDDNYLKPNRNCNSSTWVSGCEPGWACSIGQNEVDLRDAQEIPARTQDCDTCCEGFFCPRGLTCMIPCPLGAYCPLATLNATTGLCDPYSYQLPSGRPEHTCGGANIWADVGRSSEMFCSAGSYCPSTVQNQSCSSGHYCRMGSTVEAGCFKMTSCKADSTNQNIQAYGILLIVVLCVILAVIYTCSDQVLRTRERRLAKSREVAVKSAKETAKARERWKAAKNAAKGVQAHLSRKLSRNYQIPGSEELKVLSVQAKSDSNEHEPHYYPPMHEIVEEHESHLHGKNGQERKGKHRETNTQIFRYAYGQLEKEKATMQEQDSKVTFTRVIKMATDTETKRRPPIEVSFKDLTLTLKGKNKHLLRSVTGEIKPGRITAVMGPSGAGKTTFLSAIAGKTINCRKSGLILINGKSESIRSYRKIIGFVPQDDIVHGNLTVEENLWFSAHCRLSRTLPKADKVLIVERVIDSLGLQNIRDSVVGTVEKRGISGGQRKRVNVGLEMVMEPSLLILDEPTSGLDSASSLLLLRALRREALQGVNVCMVLHQPSYTLYKMFDDLVLLAKGGLVVYLGPVNNAEAYFSSLGINVPDRINPPDHYIDVLEGIVKPNSGSVPLNYNKDLPVQWMLHNGYPIPPDMRPDPSQVLQMSQAEDVSSDNEGGETGGGSFAGEFSHDVKDSIVSWFDKLRYNLMKFIDLSHRRTPGVFTQYRYFLGRLVKQRLREAKTQAVDYLILLLAGACLGALANVNDQSLGAAGYTYTIIGVSLLGKIAALRSFSQDKLQYWRESASGMSSLAYFLAKDTVDHFNTIVKPVVYLSMFYTFTNPRSSFADNYVVLLALIYCVTGIAYSLAIYFEPGPSQLWSVLLPVVLTLIATRPPTNMALKIIRNICYPRWALEAFIIANAQRYYGVWIITRCGALVKNGYDLNNWGLCIGVLMLFGVAARFLAFVGLLIFKKK